MSTTVTNLDRLETQIQHGVYGLTNNTRTRKAHPSYGYTKAGLRAEFNVLVGLLYAWHIVTLGPNASSLSAARAAANVLGWDLDRLADDIDAT
jgi:hypothetical protein